MRRVRRAHSLAVQRRRHAVQHLLESRIPGCMFADI